jgi:hypothetical protein
MNVICKLVTLFLLLVSLNYHCYSQSDKKKANADTELWRYEIEAVKTGTQGTYLIKVWSYSKKPEVAIEQAKKNAIHGIIFQGFAGKQGVPGQKPLANNSNLEYEKADFFKAFFSDAEGRYMKFVNLTTDGSVSAEDRLKIDKKTYKIGVVVSVNVSMLRKDLEDAGIINKLGSGF